MTLLISIFIVVQFNICFFDKAVYKFVLVNKQLMFLGWTVIRFWGKDILKDTDECIKVIEETIFENKFDLE